MFTKIFFFSEFLHNASSYFSSKYTLENAPFVYFGQNINSMDIYPDGDFYFRTLSGDTYHLMPYHYLNSGGVFLLTQISNNQPAFDSQSIMEAFPSYTNFTPSMTYYFTWSFDINSQASNVEISLVTDMHSSFMVVNYAELDAPPDQTSYYEDPSNVYHYFNASTTISNTQTKGLFVFQFNTGLNYCKGIFHKLIDFLLELHRLNNNSSFCS
jgi:hypothetical protein